MGGRGVSSGGSGKTTRVFIRVNTKTSRDKIKANQMDFIREPLPCQSENLYLSRIIEYTTYTGNVSSRIYEMV